MIRSMTAFARREGKAEWGHLTCELRSVNHRYLDIAMRLPEPLRGLESSIREQLSARLSRGKIECSMRLDMSKAAAGDLVLNQTLARRLLELANNLHECMPTPGHATAFDVLCWPGVVEQAEPNLAPVQATAMETLNQALNELVDTREREGLKLARFVKERCEALTPLVDEAARRRPLVLQRYRERLSARLSELSVNTDNGRLEQEVVIAAQRMDINEEVERLRAHLEEVHAVLDRCEPVGRRLDFLMQELNREANTLSSKAWDAATTQGAVELKVLIEQMREQVQNIE